MNDLRFITAITIGWVGMLICLGATIWRMNDFEKRLNKHLAGTNGYVVFDATVTNTNIFRIGHE